MQRSEKVTQDKIVFAKQVREYRYACFRSSIYMILNNKLVGYKDESFPEALLIHLPDIISHVDESFIVNSTNYSIHATVVSEAICDIILSEKEVDQIPKEGFRFYLVYNFSLIAKCHLIVNTLNNTITSVRFYEKRKSYDPTLLRYYNSNNVNILHKSIYNQFFLEANIFDIRILDELVIAKLLGIIGDPLIYLCTLTFQCADYVSNNDFTTHLSIISIYLKQEHGLRYNSVNTVANKFLKERFLHYAYQFQRIHKELNYIEDRQLDELWALTNVNVVRKGDYRSMIALRTVGITLRQLYKIHEVRFKYKGFDWDIDYFTD